MTIIIIVAIIAIVAFWFMGIQRKLVSSDELCQNSMSQIGVQQQSRWDAVSALVKLTKSYNEHEYNTLVDVIKQRKDITRTSAVADANAQEDVLVAAAAKIRFVAEQYPELKADATYAKTMDSLNNYENQVRMSRMVFNDSVTKYNRIVRQFPDSIVASILKFPLREYLKEVESKRELPEINI
ncbi:MAG: LemA family protein [Candidatus Cryptobacteroides sp.]|nr:LemA family protein [Bacteroides sp.]MDY5890553.1 LemA family protein [Candidatus Cryptobacteroides sp.]